MERALVRRQAPAACRSAAPGAGVARCLPGRPPGRRPPRCWRATLTAPCRCINAALPAAQEGREFGTQFRGVDRRGLRKCAQWQPWHSTAACIVTGSQCVPGGAEHGAPARMRVHHRHHVRPRLVDLCVEMELHRRQAVAVQGRPSKSMQMKSSGVMLAAHRIAGIDEHGTSSCSALRDVCVSRSAGQRALKWPLKSMICSRSSMASARASVARIWPGSVACGMGCVVNEVTL